MVFDAPLLPVAKEAVVAIRVLRARLRREALVALFDAEITGATRIVVHHVAAMFGAQLATEAPLVLNVAQTIVCRFTRATRDASILLLIISIGISNSVLHQQE